MITPQAVQDAIKIVHFHHFAGTKTMICALVMTNGHTVVGQAHAAMETPFSVDLGMSFARADAESKVSELLAFQQRNTQLAVGANHE